ncbi:MAG: hypothetical protein RBS01_04305, partial [Candidatus Dojkabacteria bacterium]|nr:hypothetical protein [Candidatus Dojkabacteria bacterium]
MPRKNIAIAVFPALLFVFLLSLFFLLSPQFQSNAQEDGSPPVLVDFALSTNEVDSDTEGEVTVYVRVSDDSGIDSISGYLRPMAYDDDTNWETQQLSL